MAAQAMNKLTAHINDLGQSNKIDQLRTEIINVLSFSDPNDNGLSVGLKQIALKNLDKVFTGANDSQRIDLADALKSGIEKLKYAHTAAEEVPDPEEKEAKEQLIKQNRHLSKELVLALTRLAQTKPVVTVDNKPQDIRTNAIELFLKLASVTPRLQADGEPTEQVDPHLRVSALQGLNTLRSFDYQESNRITELCSKILEEETDATLRGEAEGLKHLVSRRQPDSHNSEEYFAAMETLKQADNQMNIEEARAYVASKFPASINGLASMTEERLASRRANEPNPHLHVISELPRIGLEKVFGSITPEAERTAMERKRVDELTRAENLQALHKGMDELGEDILKGGDKAKVAQASLDLMCIDGYPIIPAFRKEAQEYAAKVRMKVCLKGNDEVRERMAPGTAFIFTHAPMMPDTARQDFLTSLLSFAPSVEGNRTSGKPLLTGPQFASLVSKAEIQAIKHIPQNRQDARYATNQNLQRSLLSALSLYQTEEQIPLLAAIADEEIKPSLERDETGLPSKQHYSDGTSKSVERKNGEVIAFTLTDKYEHADRWVKDGDKFYRESDLLKKQHPWACTPDLLADGSFVIQDQPDRSLVKPKNTLGLLTQEKEAAFNDGKSAGGTLSTEHGSQTIYRADGSKIVEVPFPSEADKKTNLNQLWVQITEAGGKVRSQIYDRSAEGWRSDWTKLFSQASKEAIPERLRRTESQSRPSGMSIDPNDLSDHPMSTIRSQARSMLAHLTEETHMLRPTTDEDPNRALVELQKITTDLKDKLKKQPVDPLSIEEEEQVCKAIFSAGLAKSNPDDPNSARIKDETDPRRALIKELLSSGDERVRLSVAHVLFEQSDILADKQAGALELANIAQQGSLLGYRQDAQKTIEAARKNLGPQTDPTIRIALASDVDSAQIIGEIIAEDHQSALLESSPILSDSNKSGNSSLSINLADSPLRLALRKLLSDPHESVSFNAARILINSKNDEDTLQAIDKICQLAKGANDLGMRDRALEFVRDVKDIGFIDRSGFRQVLLDTLPFTTVKPSPQGSQVTHADKTQDSGFKERYHAVKLALSTSKNSYLAQFHDNLLKGNPEFNLLDRDVLDTNVMSEADHELGMGWMFFYKPDYEKASKDYQVNMRQQVSQLKTLATQDVQEDKTPGEGHLARVTLGYVSLTDHGDLGWETTKAMAR